ncbi:MAG: hypothetical protein ACLFVP_05575 [Candidatus Bathyarchaeia archaeon]
MDPYRPFTTMGTLLIIIGILLVALPVIARRIPNIEEIPWFILWVYRSDGFTFATSPLLIFISLLSVLLNLLRAKG